MVSAMDSGSKVHVQALERSLCCILGQDILLSQSVSPPRSINRYSQTVRKICQNAGVGGWGEGGRRVTSDRLASHPW